MSEYVTVEARATGDPDIIEITTNMTLTAEAEEVYPDFDSGDQGSPIAQMLFNGVQGLRALRILPDTLIVTRQPDTEWEGLIDDIRDALRDFFL